MATVRALRGVCVGANQHLQPGETAEVVGSDLQYLIALKAVEIYEPEPVGEVAKPKPVKEK